MLSQMSTEHRFSTPYHPRANGLAERAVRITVSSLRKVLHGALHNWVDHHPFTQLFANIKVHSLHLSSPFSLIHGRQFNSFTNHENQDISQPLDEKALQLRLLTMKDLVFPAINLASQTRMKKVAEKFNIKHAFTSKDPFPIGSYVMLKNATKGSKFEATFEGPFKVLRRNKGGAYILQDSTGALLPRNAAPSQMKLIDRGQLNSDLVQ